MSKLWRNVEFSINPLVQSNQEEVELAHPFTLRDSQKCRTQQFARNQLAKKRKPEPLSIRRSNDKPSRISFGPSGCEKDASTPLLTIGKKPLSQFTKTLMRSSSMTKSHMSDIDDQFLSPIRQFKDYKPTFGKKIALIFRYYWDE